MNKLLSIFVALLFIYACTPLELAYRRAPEKDGWNGYYDKEIKPGVFLLEVQKIGGFGYEGKLNPVLMQNYDRRAAELCPNGYTKEVNVIKPYQAYFDTFRCTLLFCQEYPMLSGEVKCNK